MARETKLLLLVNGVVLLLGVILGGSGFFSAYNLTSVALQLPEIALLAFGVSLAMISGNGGIDLSVVSVSNLSTIVAALISFHLRNQYGLEGWPFVFVFLILTLAVAAVAGLTNGWLISRLSLPPILVTLGTMQAYFGLAIGLTKGTALYGFPPELMNISFSSVAYLPIPFLVLVVVTVALTFLLRQSVFGFRLYLGGSNPKAARVAALSYRRVLLTTYAASALLAGLAGFLVATRVNSVKADYGSSYLLVAILITILGGVNPAGGYGKLFNVLLGAVSLQLLFSLFNLMYLSNFLTDAAWGLLLLAVIALQRTRLLEFLSASRKGGMQSAQRAG